MSSVSTVDPVITGLGVVSACGAGAEPLSRALADGASPTTEVDQSSRYHRAARRNGGPPRRGSTRAALVAGADLGSWLSPAKARRMSPLSRLAVVAAHMAHAPDPESAGEHSAREGEDDDGELCGVYLGCAYGPTSITERILRQVFLEGPTAVSPSLFTESVANAPAAQIALQLGLRGPNVTVTQREAGSLIALGLATAEIRSGRLRRALSGAVDEVDPLLHAALDQYGALARPRRGEPERARPFDRRRAGFVVADGATVVVVEPENVDAGRRALARIRHTASAFDPEAPSTGWSRNPDRLASALARELENAAVAPEDLDLVVSGANGSIAGDRLEALVLRRVWGERDLPPIVTPKAVTGEQGGSTLATAVLALGGQRFGPTPGFERVDPELGVRPHDGSPLPQPRRVLVTGLAVGGAAAWTLLESCDG